MQARRNPASKGCDSVIGTFRRPAEAELVGLLQNIAELQKNTKLDTGYSMVRVSRCVAPHLLGEVVQTERDAVFTRCVEAAD